MDMDNDLRGGRVTDAYEAMRANAPDLVPLAPDPSRLAFVDPEFMVRDATRGIRLELELLKADLALIAARITSTVVVFGSARTLSPEQAEAELSAAVAVGDPVAIATANRNLRNSTYYAQARTVGRLVSEWSLTRPESERLYICTGGGPGIMEAANRGADDVNFPSVALSIALPFEEKANPYTDPELTFTFHYFAMRKMHFMLRAKALIAFPGGFGTLDELFEVLTLVQTRKSEAVPVVLYGSEYWKQLINFDLLIDQGLISANDVNLVTYVDSPEDALGTIRRFYSV